MTQRLGNDDKKEGRRRIGWTGRTTSFLTILILVVLIRLKGEHITLETLFHDDFMLYHNPPLIPAPMDQPIPPAFIYAMELYTTKEKTRRKITNSTIIMDPEVYERLTDRIRRIKQTRKPLLIMINSHPCAGKSFFIENNTGYFMGYKLVDFDKLGHGVMRDSSYLKLDTVTNNTVLFGDQHVSALNKQENYDDVIYIYVIPPMTRVMQNMELRQKDPKSETRFSEYGPVTNRRRISLSYAIKNEVLVEPLFASFQEGLAFCINTYNAATE